jgi:hypothetical protein
MQHPDRDVSDPARPRASAGQAGDRSYDASPRRPGLPRPIVTVCACCRRVHALKDHWIAREAVSPSPRGSEISHGLCPDCATALLLEPDADPVVA